MGNSGRTCQSAPRCGPPHLLASVWPRDHRDLGRLRSQLIGRCSFWHRGGVGQDGAGGRLGRWKTWSPRGGCGRGDHTQRHHGDDGNRSPSRLRPTPSTNATEIGKVPYCIVLPWPTCGAAWVPLQTLAAGAARKMRFAGMERRRS